MPNRIIQKKITMRVSPDGTRRFVVVANDVTNKADVENKTVVRRTRNADFMAKELFG